MHLDIKLAVIVNGGRFCCLGGHWGWWAELNRKHHQQAHTAKSPNVFCCTHYRAWGFLYAQFDCFSKFGRRPLSNPAAAAPGDHDRSDHDHHPRRPRRQPAGHPASPGQQTAQSTSIAAIVQVCRFGLSLGWKLRISCLHLQNLLILSSCDLMSTWHYILPICLSIFSVATTGHRRTERLHGLCEHVWLQWKELLHQDWIRDQILRKDRASYQQVLLFNIISNTYMHDCLSILWWQYLQRQNAARQQTVVTLQTRTAQLHSNATKIPAVQMVTSINVIVFKHYMYRISASGWTWNQIHEHTTYQITIWDTQQTPDSVVSVATFVTLLVLIDLIWSKARVLPVRLTMSVAIPHATRMVDAVSSKAQAWAKEKTDHEIIHSLPINISWGLKRKYLND